MTHARRLLMLALMGAVVATISFAQPGRGGSQWLTALADAQRTSWIRTDDKISVPAISKGGFELQWTVKLDNPSRGLHGLAQGVTAAGVTLFVPMSLVAGSSNKVFAIDNDIGYVVWQRDFDLVMPAPTPACPGGITAAATRIVRLDAAAAAAPGSGRAGRGSVGYRSLLGEPGEGVPVEGRGRGRAGGDPSGVPPAGDPGARGAGRGAGASPPGAAMPVPGARSGQAAERIPGAPRAEEGQAGASGFLFRPSGVGYVISSDGMLHVLGLPSGKDMQRPAQFLPPNSKWSSPVAVGTTLYAATTGDCGGAPSGVWAIDLDSDAKPVVSWKTNGGAVVGAVAFTSDGTLIASIGAGRTSGDGKANAVVALDSKTLELKDWFTSPTAEFVTGPTILRHDGKDIIASATKDGRLILLDATSLGGGDHATPLYSSRPLLGTGSSVSADALAAWQQSVTGAAPPPSTGGTPGQGASGDVTSWILVPFNGRPSSELTLTNGPISSGGVVAMKLTDTSGALSLEPGWVSHDLTGAATPLIVNGVVFALATGRPGAPGGRGTPAVLHAYDGADGKRLWNSGKGMTSFASPGSLWSGLGQIYVGTQDGTMYAFGFDDERQYGPRR